MTDWSDAEREELAALVKRHGAAMASREDPVWDIISEELSTSRTANSAHQHWQRCVNEQNAADGVECWTEPARGHATRKEWTVGSAA